MSGRVGDTGNAPVVIAQWSGVCSECDERFHAGEPIVPGFPVGWKHQHCHVSEDGAAHGVCTVCFQAKAANGTCGCETGVAP